MTPYYYGHVSVPQKASIKEVHQRTTHLSHAKVKFKTLSVATYMAISRMISDCVRPSWMNSSTIATYNIGCDEASHKVHILQLWRISSTVAQWSIYRWVPYTTKICNGELDQIASMRASNGLSTHKNLSNLSNLSRELGTYNSIALRSIIKQSYT